MLAVRIICATFLVTAVCAKVYGIWNIAFLTGKAEMDSNGGKCDGFWSGKSVCDPYVLLLVEGSEVFRTAVHHNKERPTFHETYEHRRMDRDWKIIIEMWDHDKTSGDDLMSRWGPFYVYDLINMEHVTETRDDKENLITFESNWIPPP